MDWYFGSRIDEHAVPKDQELPDRVISPSPEILSKWETYDAPDKYFSMDTNVIEQQFNFNDFCNEDKSHSTCSSSICAGSSEESMQRTALSNNRPDYQLDHFAGIEQLDDIFLNSLIENLPGTEDLHKSFCFDRESQYGVMPANNLAGEMSFESQSNSTDEHGVGSSKYLKIHAFSLSMSVENRDGDCSSEHDFLPVKAPLAKLQVPCEQNIAKELPSEETSLEESVLQDLIMVMAQLTDKTRMCFRDALYRLAENSKQHLSVLKQNGDFTAETPEGTGHDKNIRSGKKKGMESETNVIDRAIANLLFNKMDLNVRDFPAVSAVNPEQEVVADTGLAEYRFNQPRNHHFCEAMLAGDAEVPMLQIGNKIK